MRSRHAPLNGPAAFDRWRRHVRSLGWFREVRTGFLAVVGLAMAPLVILASTLAAQQAGASRDPADWAVWGAAAVLPVALGFGGCLAISFATEAWILRWLRYFERIAGLYAKGRYNLRPLRTSEAPAEFQSLGIAVAEMASAVASRDRDLRIALDERGMLLREVHHRVKNNLQVTSSLLGLQLARADDPKVKDAILDALLRLDAMAITERYALEEDQTGEVSTRRLFDEWAGQIRARLGHGTRSLDLTTNTGETRLRMDVATPLVLIATEILLQTFRSCDHDPLPFAVDLGSKPDTVSMRLSLDGCADAALTSPGLSPSLVDAYLRQIKGQVARAESSPVVVVEAPLRGRRENHPPA